MIPLKTKNKGLNLTSNEEGEKSFESLCSPKMSGILSKSYLNQLQSERHGGSSSVMLQKDHRPTVNSMLKGILKKTFKNNHIEDLKLHTLNYSQKNYLNKIMKERKSLVPFKLPYRDDESQQREIQYQQVTALMASATDQKKKALNKTVNRQSRLRLPQLSPNLTPKLNIFEKRFNSVKSSKKKRMVFSNNSPQESQKEFPNTSARFTSIKEALPVAILRKKQNLGKTEDEEESKSNVKKFIKVKNPKQYHKKGLLSNELTTGKPLDNTLDSKILQGRSYLISVSPSQKNYDKNIKKKFLLKRNFLNQSTEEFKIEDQYENRAAVQKIRYKKVWHPVFCQSATLTNLKGYTYLIGGVNHSVIKQVCCIANTDSECLWKVFKDDHQTILQRYGHTCNIYKDSLIIFGGQKGSASKKAKRLVLNDIWLYNPQVGTLEQILTKSGPDLCYGHSACVAGNYLVVHGGVNEMGDVLQDLGVLDIAKKKWLKVNMPAKGAKNPPGICFSRMVAVFYEGRKKNPHGEFFGKYKQDQNLDPFLPKPKRDKIKDKDIILEGCYMFGGITNDNDIIDHLYILKIQNEGKDFEWEKVEDYNGKSPCERSHHFMEYLKFNNSILVFGGRNDNNQKSSVLNDMYFLQMDTLTWISVTYANKKPAARFSHACGIQDSKLIIFGGVNSNFEMEQSVEVIEFDPEKFGNTNFTNILH
ncbi:unnamed protein product [Moneuplotes crassus]|uniref:Kelch motif family protein n=1 Tax=Euplotes crassus TaxID=5936 RepID=A0AAD1U241_EUPCR|nr:unnamed protein product [Moneuplotes crassus]